MIRTLGIGSEDQIRDKKGNGSGLMEAYGTSPSGQINLSSNSRRVEGTMTVSRFTIICMHKMDGMTIFIILRIHLFAAGKFAQVMMNNFSY